MVDLSEKLTKKKKRKLNSSGEKRNPKKRHRIDSSKKEPTEVEEGESWARRGPDINPSEERPWRNLQLILSLQNKQVDLQKKVELAFDFVNSREQEGRNNVDEDHETVNISRLIVFLNDWIQSLLVSPEKNVVDGIVEACLDFRCWRIFKFCLKESLRLHVSLNFLRNVLRAIGYIARNVLSLVSDTSLSSNESFLVGEGFELYGVVLDCVSLLFSFHSGLSNENLEVWVSTIDVVLQLAHKIYTENLDGGNIGAFALQFSCVVLEPFAKFLRIHPTRKNGFRDFVDKLLEPVLLLVGVLHSQINADNSGWTKNLLKLVEEVLSHGLFHPAHIDGFLGLRSVEKYAGLLDGKAKDSKVMIKSYHRHLFDKLESIIKVKKDITLSGIGQLFHMFVDRVKKQKGAFSTGTTGKIGSSRHLEDGLSGHLSMDPSRSSSAFPDNNYSSSNLSAEARKSLFDFFVQLLEPLLLEMNGYIQSNLAARPSLLDAHCTLKSINSLLASFLHDKVYVRTEDISEGACLNFLKTVYDTVVSFASKLVSLSELNIDTKTERKMFPLLAKELFLAVGYFLDIEYDVIGNDLISLWVMMLSYLTTGVSFLDSPDQCSLTSPILDLGCQLVNLYSSLRQVNNSIFTLCKAVRLLISHHQEGEMSCTRFFSYTTSLPNEASAASVGILLCSQEFKLAVHHAIKSIPEGQVSGLICQLTADVSESIEWMKIGCSKTDGKEIGRLDMRDHGMLDFHMQAELLGRVLAEIYMILLDSLTVTVGNCSLLGPSVKELVNTIYPCISSLVEQHPDGVNEFLSFVMGRTSKNMAAENEKEKHRITTQWIFIFLFQLYMSCRSLYRQVISLTPPSTSRKLSSAMGDAFTAYTGRDWMEKSDWTEEGYFSWIINPSPSLLDLVHHISNIYIKDNIEDCCPLIYVLHVMALQRLVDLNRHRSTLQYLLQQGDKLMQVKKLDDADLSLYRKKCRKLKRHILVLEQEAVELTDFMLGYLSLVANYHSSIFSSDDTSCEKKACFQVHESDKWDFSISSVNKKSLPIAIWWIICQSIDIWCSYVDAKKLKRKFKKFLMLLIQTSLPCLANSSLQIEKHKIGKDGQLKKITLYQISQGLLKDSTLYENKFVRRNLASSFCHALENSVLSLFSDSSVRDINFKSLPVWPEVLSKLDNSSTVVCSRRDVKHDSAARSISNSSDRLPSEISMKQKAFPIENVKFKDCQSLLNLLCWMPKGYLNSKSFCQLTAYVLNLERIVVEDLLGCQGALSSNGCYELFQLFVACRRTLKNIIMASCEEKIEGSLSSLLSVAEGSSFVIWLFKSVSTVIGVLDTMMEDCLPEFELKIFLLMDHTSYVFFAISKYQFGQAVHFIGNSEKPCKKQPYSGVVGDESILNQPGSCSNYLKDSEALRSLSITAENLKEQAESLLDPLKGALDDNAKVGDGNKAVNTNKMSFAISCFGGFLWGLASALNQGDEKSGEVNAKYLRWKCEPLSKLNICINVFLDFISEVFHMFLDNDQQSRSYYDAESSQKLDYSRHLLVFETDLVELHYLNKHFLQGLLKGDHPDRAILLRHLLITHSAIPRLNLRIDDTSLSSGMVPLNIGISQVLLLELANSGEIPPPFTFVWLDGAVKYLEELGSHFPLNDPTLNGNAYAKLIELLLRAIGKCISLQGKRATLESHERESSTKILHGGTGWSESFLSHGSHCLDEFKARLRMSFKAFIKNPSELQLLSAMQAIERALVGVRGGHAMIYDINTGSANGGMVSSTVAAGIDCLDLILEYGSGRRCLRVVKRHIQSLVAALFNIILHLQSPLIFYGKFVSNEGDRNPDAGSVVLMCAEVLTRVARKHALFQMDPWHIGQSLCIPGALFQDFHQLRLSEAPVSNNSLLYSDKQTHDSMASMKYSVVDRQFSVNLFAACCRLLYTVLKHHKSECERCIAVLEESVALLLHCLETVDADLVVRKGYFSWEIQEGVKCACFLRRIYEEIRQQKDVFAGHCYKFLSTYIWVYSGYGPLKTGIRREIDGALKPGVYALIDACSANDLQYLHTVFGEGPCRNTLASLQRDYKLNFQYEGKV
ncbi:Urb2/Npa2, putative isoform 2 [Theobroma cacao]|uniref:Urb2/Npa2, putative isoform 2 n=1 Tax=Theobroma cacao TaxID=3641 RepID=A0A061E0C3_THECC|nr:Urb2/Npa2, putative isoform 2 [Theobroma cacao]